MKKIKLTQNQYALVDNEDFERLDKFKWHIKKQSNSSYAARTKNNKTLRMHRIITDCPKDMVVDHINGDGLDNRKENLRVCTRKENSMNRKLNKNNSLNYKGVRLHTPSSKYQVRLRQKHIGLFDCIHKAAKAYNKAALEMFKEFAKLNEV